MLNELLERYWQSAFDEANKDRDHDTIDHLAQRTLIAIHAEVQRLVEAEREACAKACADRAKDVPGKLPTPDAYKDEAMLCAATIRMRSNV